MMRTVYLEIRRVVNEERETVGPTDTKRFGKKKKKV